MVAVPNINHMYPSKYLKADDIGQGNTRTFTVARVVQETVGEGGDAQQKWCIYFHETEQGLVLNQTNAHLIAMQYGDETDQWMGRTVHLTVAMVEFMGKIVPGIRVAQPPQAPPLPPGQTPAYGDHRG